MNKDSEEKFLQRSKDKFNFVETDMLVKYQNELVKEIENGIYSQKEKHLFLNEIQTIERFVKTIHSYA